MSRAESEAMAEAVLAALRHDEATRQRLIRALAVVIEDRRRQAGLRKRHRSLDR